MFTLFLSCHIDLEDIYSPVRRRPWQIRLAFTPKHLKHSPLSLSLSLSLSHTPNRQMD